MTDTIEAVARALCEHVFGSPKGWRDFLPETRVVITAHTKALIEGAGEVEKKCAALAVQIDPLLLGGPDARLLNQAAATIAALKAEIERLTEREAQAKLDGVRAGIEASAVALISCDPPGDVWPEMEEALHALDPAAIIRAQALSELAAADAVLLDMPEGEPQ